MGKLVEFQDKVTFHRDDGLMTATCRPMMPSSLNLFKWVQLESLGDVNFGLNNLHRCHSSWLSLVGGVDVPSASSFQDYKDLSLASGGQAIQVSKSQLPQATDVILDTSTSALVWLCSSNSAFSATRTIYQAFHSWTSLKIEIHYVFIVVRCPLGDSSSASKELWEGDLPLHVGWISEKYHHLHHRNIHHFNTDQSCR